MKRDSYIFRLLRRKDLSVPAHTDTVDSFQQIRSSKIVVGISLENDGDTNSNARIFSDIGDAKGRGEPPS